MKQIIVLNTRPNQPEGGAVSVACVFWFTVTDPAKRVARPNVNASQWSGASPDDIAKLQSGEVIEEAKNYQFPDNLSAANIKARLLEYYTRRGAYLAALPVEGQYYGVYSDSVSGWSA